MGRLSFQPVPTCPVHFARVLTRLLVVNVQKLELKWICQDFSIQLAHLRRFFECFFIAMTHSIAVIRTQSITQNKHSIIDLTWFPFPDMALRDKLVTQEFIQLLSAWCSHVPIGTSFDVQFGFN